MSASGRSPGGGHGNPLQYSCLENPMEREAWQAIGHGAAELDMTEAILACTKDLITFCNESNLKFQGCLYEALLLQ